MEYTMQAVVKFPPGLNINCNNQSSTNIDNNTPIPFGIFNYHEEEGIVKLFNSLKKTDRNYIFCSNVFSNFVPNWRELKEMHNKIDNIFNTYCKLSKLFKSVKNKGKIKDNNRRIIK